MTRLIGIVAVTVALTLGACGRKGDPEPPTAALPHQQAIG